MKTVKIVSLRSSLQIADACYVADSFLSRLKGLIGKQEFKDGSALLLNPCSDIHMWFMKIPIDAVFLKKAKGSDPSRFIVTSLSPSLKPWKLFPVADFKASATLELPEGSIKAKDIKIGDELCIS